MRLFSRPAPTLRALALAALVALLLAVVAHAVSPFRPVVELRRGVAAWVDTVDLAVEVRIHFIVGSG